jgi:hypothetical protein
MLGCIRCNHVWTQRTHTGEPKCCPKCKSPYWNTPRTNREYFDPAVHGDDRKELEAYIKDVHNGNITSAAYQLGIEYPYLNRLIKQWRVIPSHLIEKIKEIKGEPPVVEQMSQSEIKNSFDINAPIQVPSGHRRWTLDDYITPISPKEHTKECAAFRRLFADQYDNNAKNLTAKHGYSLTDIRRMYIGQDKINALVRKELLLD